MTTYRFTATFTKRPFSQTAKGSIKVIGGPLDALREVHGILKLDDELLDGTSIKITITPSRKKA